MGAFSPRFLMVLLAVVIVVAGCGDARENDKPKVQKKAPAKSEFAEAQKLIARHQELVKSGAPIAEAQRRQFADAYYAVGAVLYRNHRRADSEPYFRQALALSPEHARAMLRLGDLQALKRQFKAAAQAYAQAGRLEPSLRKTVLKRRERLCDFVLAIADQRLADSQIRGAMEVLDFVQKYLADVDGGKASERLKALEPMLRAEALLNAATQDITRSRRDAGYKKLRQLATEYPHSYFGQEANRLLEENGQKIVLHGTATGYKLPPHWRRATTEHFEIYYEKRTALTGMMRYAETAFSKIVTDFGMTDTKWKTRIVVYLFSDDDSWQEFLAMNRDRTMEWSGGFAVPTANEIYLYVTDSKKYLYKRLMPHELTHVLHHRYVGGIGQPLWLKEGLARFQEKGGVKEARDAIDDLVKDGKAFTLSDLFKLTYYPPTAISLFYAQSATVVGFMIDEYGLDRFKEFMFAFAGTNDAAEAIERVYGMSLDTFEQKWDKYVR